jgi:hypothetical protein
MSGSLRKTIKCFVGEQYRVRRFRSFLLGGLGRRDRKNVEKRHPVKQHGTTMRMASIFPASANRQKDILNSYNFPKWGLWPNRFRITAVKASNLFSPSR